MNDFESLWRAVELSLPNDPAALCACADFIEEERPYIADKLELAYALKWCAGHRKRPWFRSDLARKRWEWYRGTGNLTNLTGRQKKERGAAMLPRYLWNLTAVKDGMTGGWDVRKTSLGSYRALGRALAALRSVVEVPNIVAPPQPVIELPPQRIKWAIRKRLLET